jgi:hypothetical protein
MKMLFLFACVTTLITTTGCFFPEGGEGRGEHRRHDRGEFIVAPRAVAVRAPEVILAPPVVAVNAPEVVVR